MINANIIVIEKSKDSIGIADITFSILKNNSYNTILIKDNSLRINDVYLDNININKIDDFFMNRPKSSNILVINNEEDKDVKEIISNNKIDTIVNTIQGETCDKNNFFLYKNIKKNGTVVCTSDSKDIFDYFRELNDKIVITYGLSSRATLTTSSIDVSSGIDNNEVLCCNVCLQRGITSKKDNEIEPVEFPVKILKQNNVNEYSILAAIAVALIYDIPIDKIQDSFSKYLSI